jgi:hypothetical protein
LRAYQDQLEASSSEELTDPLIDKLAQLKDFAGTAKELADALKVESSTPGAIRQMTNRLRRLQNALESKGIHLAFRRSHGKKLVTVSA